MPDVPDLVQEADPAVVAQAAAVPVVLADAPVQEHQRVKALPAEHQVVAVLADQAADSVDLPDAPVVVQVVVVPVAVAALKVPSVALADQFVADVRASARNAKSSIRCKRRPSVACASARAMAKSYVWLAEHP